MIKLLQKYKMQILVVVGIFVIISFLMADAIKQVTQYAFENKRVFTIGGDKVTQADVQAANMHFDGLKRVVGQEALLRPLGLEDNSQQWHLASLAAERAGVVGGPADGRATARIIALQLIARDAQQKGFNDWRTYLKQTYNLTDEQVDARVEQATDSAVASASRAGNAISDGANAFAEYRGLIRLLHSYGDVPQTSETRLAAEARRLLDVAVVKYVYVPLTQARIDAAPAPTPEEMQAQFEKFKDTPVGTGEGGAGYRQNDRITYSWFSIDKAAISKAVRVDPIEVSKRALERSKGDAVEPNLRSTIESEIRGELTQRVLDDLTAALRAEFLKQSALLPEKDGYKVLPADWKKPDLAAAVTSAVQRISTEKKVTIAVPEVHAVTTPQDARTFVLEKGIGVAMLPRSGQQMSLAREVLFAAKEFGKPAGRLPAQVGLPIPSPFTSFDGNLYYVMIDSAIPSATPKSLDEARPLVEADLRRVKALAQLKADIESRLQPVIEQGMTAAPAQLALTGFPGLTVISAQAQRIGAEQGGGGIVNDNNLPTQPEVQDKTFVEAAVSRAEKLDPAQQVRNDTAADRTFVHPLSNAKGVVLAQVTGLKPLTLENFRIVAAEPRFRAMVEALEIGRDAPPPRPFATESLVKRFNITGLEAHKSDEEP